MGGPQLRWEPLPIYSVARPSRTAALEPAGPAVSPPAFSGAAPPEVLAPEGCPLRDYRPQDFTARLTVAAARQAMEQTAGKGSGLLGLLDPQGIAPWACGEWLDCCRGVKVYTLRRSRYAAAETMLRVEYGLPLLWAETPAELEDCSICAAPYPTGVIRVRRPIITADRSGIQGNPTVNRLTLALTPEQLAEVPPGAEQPPFGGW